MDGLPQDYRAAVESLMGRPSIRGRREWRYGRKGSLAIAFDRDGGIQWYDFETSQGGGWRQLVARERGEAEAERMFGRRGRTRQATKPVRTHSDRDAARRRAVDAVWAALPLTGTPGEAWLKSRRLLPPDGELSDTQWLPRHAWPRTHGPLPGEAAGAIAFAFRRQDGRLAAVQLDALTASGRPTRPRVRKTVGSVKAAYYAPAGCDWTGRIAVAEGPCDAIALHWMHPDSSALAVGGTAGLAALDPRPFAAALEVVIESDGDAPGRDAARSASHALYAAGVKAPVVFRRAGDPADDWATEFSQADTALGLETAWRMARDGDIMPGDARTAERFEVPEPEVAAIQELYADCFGAAGHAAALDEARRRLAERDFPAFGRAGTNHTAVDEAGTSAGRES